MDAAEVVGNKAHHPRQAGAKAEKRRNAVKKKKEERAEGTAAEANIKNNNKKKDPRVRVRLCRFVPYFPSITTLFTAGFRRGKVWAVAPYSTTQ